MPNMDDPQTDLAPPPDQGPSAQDLQALVAMKKLQELAQEAQRASRRNLIITSVVFLIVLTVLAGVMLLGFTVDKDSANEPSEVLAAEESASTE